MTLFLAFSSMFYTSYYSDDSSGIICTLYTHPTFEEAVKDYDELVAQITEVYSLDDYPFTSPDWEDKNYYHNRSLVIWYEKRSYRFYDWDCRYYQIKVDEIKPDELIDIHY